MFLCSPFLYVSLSFLVMLCSSFFNKILFFCLLFLSISPLSSVSPYIMFLSLSLCVLKVTSTNPLGISTAADMKEVKKLHGPNLIHNFRLLYKVDAAGISVMNVYGIQVTECPYSGLFKIQVIIFFLLHLLFGYLLRLLIFFCW